MTNERASANSTTLLDEKLEQAVNYLQKAENCFQMSKRYMQNHDQLDRNQVHNHFVTMASQFLKAQTCLEEAMMPNKGSAEALFKRWLKARDAVNWLAQHPDSNDDLTGDLDIALQELERKILKAPVVNPRDLAAKVLCTTQMGDFEDPETIVGQALEVMGIGRPEN